MSIIWVAVKFIPYNFIFGYYIENVHNLIQFKITIKI